MPKRTTPASASAPPMNVVLITMDAHLSTAAERAAHLVAREVANFKLNVHVAAEWASDSQALSRCLSDIAKADILIVTMLFMEEHFVPVLPALTARRNSCDAMVCCMSAPEITRLTRMGKFDMSVPSSGPLALLKRLRGKQGQSGTSASATAGARQMKMLRRLPKLLRFIPGTAQDVRAYFITLQYWLGGSQENLANLMKFLINRYATGPRAALAGALEAEAPQEYPEVGLYHPSLPNRLTDDLSKLKQSAKPGPNGTVGLLLMRSYLLAGNTAHYDGVIAALEARGLNAIPAFATGLDSRPAAERFFFAAGQSATPIVDAVVSLTGFSLVGGPAYNDSKAAEELLARLDVPYLAVTPVEFQSLQEWERSDRGLLPVEATMMVAIPELDGATGSMVFGGRVEGAHDMQPHHERAGRLADRVQKLVQLRRSSRASRKVAVVIFNFPPNAGNTGTAAYLDVFASLYNTLTAMQAGGYSVDLPANIEALRSAIVDGNRERFGAHANVHTRIAASDHVRREPFLAEIENQWGAAPGKQQSDGSSLFVLGAQFGNVFVGVQPAFGYEGDPMRLLFEKGFAPTHAFSAFYRYLREDFGAHAVLHFGTHGALEFMPGKQTGMTAACWPDRLIGDVPNIYLYASNNPSEGSIAKRRAAATLVSYLTPPVAHSGLYRGLLDLKASLEQYRSQPDAGDQLVALIQSQAALVNLADAEPTWAMNDATAKIAALVSAVTELETTLIPHGLHVVGEMLSFDARVEMLIAAADASHSFSPPRVVVEAIAMGASPAEALQHGSFNGVTAEENSHDRMQTVLAELAQMSSMLAQEHEIAGLLHALDAGFVRPAPGGDVLRTPAVLPTGRNIHGFDPFRIPSAFALIDGAAQATKLLARHMRDGAAFPESIAMVLWGTDNLKTEGGPIAQALALIGAKPRFDSYGRLTGASLIPLTELKRPRIDVIVTLSGIFRDLLPLQIKLLAEAAYLAAAADEPVEQNFIRKHALAYQAEHGGDLESAALRVFGNAEGAYGANVNHLIDNSRWEEEDELAETYARRKGFAYGRSGRAAAQPELLQSVLAKVELAYQNLDSVELGVTTVDHYFDTLGGISRAVKRARGAHADNAPVYIGDQTAGGGTVRTLQEQVALETHTRMLNPKWYEGMLKHGYEGVRQIEAHITNTMGWSATTGQVAPWVYQELTRTFVLDDAMRNRLAALNPTASAKLANRLLEAHQRKYWSPDASVLDALRRAGEELEDRLEGVYESAAPNTPNFERVAA
jgi:magnesium chelatase subunit H